jgi:hypothetical protein
MHDASKKKANNPITVNRFKILGLTKAHHMMREVAWPVKSLPNQLGIHLFLAKQKKLCSNSLASNLVNFSNLANLPPPRVYLRAERECASGFTCIFKRGSSFLSGALRFLTELFVRLAGLFLFYQVQMANSWREFIFSLAIYFSELPNHDIC